VAVHGHPMEHSGLSGCVTTVTIRVPPDAGIEAGVVSKP
jgi:hypothetical protein